MHTLFVNGSPVKDFEDYKEAMKEALKLWLEGLHVFVDQPKDNEEVWTNQPISDEVIERTMKKLKKTQKHRNT